LLGDALPEPGQLFEVGPAEMATGGSVGNSGLALHRMGIPVKLIAAVGDDMFGREIERIFNQCDAPHHLERIIGSATSYTIVISTPGSDRRFLHCPGTNEVFTDAQVRDQDFKGARWLHFGYPPAMRGICEENGEPLRRLMARAKASGLITSLDTSGIDPQSWNAKVDWRAVLKNVLPQVSVFLPSADELASMQVSVEELLAMGVQVVVVKDGERGLHVQSGDVDFAPSLSNQSFDAPTYEVDVVGTTGAGDTTIAGFIAGMLQGRSLQAAADLACAAGAHCVQRIDAVSGIPALDEIQKFVDRNPPRRT
jgi:sugar/nucleoside kinase (ribokinase family)